ncbi:uncharacterized protein LOC144148351 [Haemaphysalis longicornis]
MPAFYPGKWLFNSHLIGEVKFEAAMATAAFDDWLVRHVCDRCGLECVWAHNAVNSKQLTTIHGSCIDLVFASTTSTTLYRLRTEPQSRVRTAEVLSTSRLLDINRIERSLFEQQFRFQKDDIDGLVEALLIPEVVMSAHKVTAPGRDARCLALRRLAYPNKWCHLQGIFGLHYSVISSVTSKLLKPIVGTFGHLLNDCNHHTWLSPGALANAVQRKGAPLTNCWAFNDGTDRPICRPKRNQKAYFLGHKQVHCLKYQSLMCPNGIICQLDGPYPGRRHDADKLGILKDSGLYFRLEPLVKNDYYVIYNDPAYTLQPLIMKPYGGFSLTAVQEAFNKGMSSVRQAVDWGFEKL